MSSFIDKIFNFFWWEKSDEDKEIITEKVATKFVKKQKKLPYNYYYYGKEFELNNYTWITPEGAKILVDWFDWISRHSQIIWKNLELNWLTNIDKESAKELAKSRSNYLYLNWLESIDLESLIALANYKWDTISLWIKKINEDIAKTLAQFKCKCIVLDIVEIKEKEIREFVKFKGHLISLWIMDINADKMAELVKFNGDVITFVNHFDIDEKMATEMIKFWWSTIWLKDEINEIPENVYYILSKFKWKIEYNTHYKY